MRAVISNNERLSAAQISGLLGFPSYGNVFYVDPGAGSDSANSGTSIDDAFATLGEAYDHLTADQDDVVIMAGSSSTGRTSESAVLTWAKRRTHVIGMGVPRKMNPRNGVGVYAADTASSFVLSATNCSFTNISFAAFGDADVMVEITGSYNTFKNVHFQGMGNATPAAEASARAVLITAAQELEFTDCTFGLDTVTRSAANATVEQTGNACARNKYIGCDFLVFTDDAAAVHFKADTGNCYERFVLFDHCNFLNADLASSTTLTVNMDLSATGNGTVLVRDSWSKGATDWTNTFTNFFLSMPLADTDEGGLTKIGT